MHTGENPGLILVSPPLNETNYHTWSRNIKRALLSKNKLKFIDGSISKPSNNDSTFEACEICNVMVLSWITRTLAPQLADIVVYIDSARSLWENLTERFSKGDYFCISDLLQEVHSIRQGERTVT